MRRIIFLVVAACTAIGLTTTPASAQDSCWAALDVNGDGIVLTVGDYVAAIRAYYGDTTIAVEWYQLDINGDCVIDDADLEMFSCYFHYGLGCFEYGFPVQTCCEPDLTVGACCLGEDSCSMRNPDNCAALGGTYMGDGVPCKPDNPCDCCEGLRDDMNGDAQLNVSDVAYFVSYLFQGGPPPGCDQEADLNGDGSPNISDLSGRLVPFLFTGGQNPAPCGPSYPLTIAYDAEEYVDGQLSQEYVITLTFAGPDSSNQIIGGIGEPPDASSLVGSGLPGTPFLIATPQYCCDYGWYARLVPFGDGYSGSGERLSFIGTTAFDLVLRPR
jgi:hypothetical protein